MSLKIIAALLKLRDSPLKLSIFGWILFPGMYLLVGIMTALGMSVYGSFSIASLAGFLGFISWLAALILSVKLLIHRNRIFPSLLAFISSAIPIAFIAWGLYIVANGGV